MTNPKLETELNIARGGRALEHGVLSLGTPSHYTCPDCHGSMVRIEDGTIKRFRCHTGHAFSELALADQAPDTIRKTLWGALAQMEEHYLLLRNLVKERAAATDDESAQYQRRAAEAKDVMEKLRTLLDAPVFQE